MGRLVYGTTASVEIDDRALAHLRIVFMSKLRRSESFMFNVKPGDGTGRRSLWVHPAVAIQFHFFSTRHPQINRGWVEDLLHAAGQPDGLTLLPEPSDASEPIRIISG